MQEPKTPVLEELTDPAEVPDPDEVLDPAEVPDITDVEVEELP